jgi:hypothetical protein
MRSRRFVIIPEKEATSHFLHFFAAPALPFLSSGVPVSSSRSLVDSFNIGRVRGEREVTGQGSER